MVGDRSQSIPSKIYPVKPGDYEMVPPRSTLIHRPLDLTGIKARAQAMVDVVRHGLKQSEGKAGSGRMSGATKPKRAGDENKSSRE